jgi:HrpA-like RNA helicase
MLPTLLTAGSIEGIPDIPIDYIIKWIKQHMYEYNNIRALLEDRILIIQAKTGSGKSTILPVEIFRLLRDKNVPVTTVYRGKNVLCTQPRVLTAIELAKRVSVKNSPYNPDMIMSKTLGFQTRPISEKPPHGLIYATLGVLSAQLNNYTDDEIMKMYKFIIIDEAHERTLNSDISLFQLLIFYQRNKGNKQLPFLILTSATIDTKKYANYFEIPHNNIITVKGQGLNIDPIWPVRDIVDIYEYISTVVKSISNNKDEINKSDVLIFMPGIKEIKELHEKLSKLKLDILIIDLDGEKIKNNTIEYFYVFADRSSLPRINGKVPRRIILTTSVAETGITINTCKYVIDSGYHRSKESYPIYNISGLINRPSSQSRIIQRKGRVGRLFDGIFYPVYTEETFNNLDVQQLPEIIVSSSDYNNVHLLLCRYDFKKIKLLDYPPSETFINANILSTTLGFINHLGQLTELGKITSRFTYISIEQAKIIFSGFAYNVAIIDLITICALMESEYIRLYMKDKDFKKHTGMNMDMPCDSYIMKNYIDKELNEISYYNYKLLFCDDFIESLLMFETFINKITIYQDVSMIEMWCKDNCINISELQIIYTNRENKINDLINQGIDIFYNSEYRFINTKIDNINSIINIKKCIYEGLRNNLLTYDSDSKSYKTLIGLEVIIDNNILDIKLQNKLKSLHMLTNEIQPKYIITDKLTIIPKKESTLLYEIKSNYISILDGYIYPDLTFGSPSIL